MIAPFPSWNRPVQMCPSKKRHHEVSDFIFKLPGRMIYLLAMDTAENLPPL